MNITIELDDELLRTARTYFRSKDLPVLLNHALKALIHIEASRRLATLGGSEPQFKRIKRIRADALRAGSATLTD